ncbi:MAG: 50S ribosomal protein L5 [Chitinivibrionales bacterium]|nr:50S ribosomal protein L5 [Chitinivibrionales bacterium]
MRVKYEEKVVPALKTRLGLSNAMQIPRIQKIVINMGVGRAVGEPKLLDEAVETLRAITGQSPVITQARQAISNFKLRKGMKIGCRVTLRNARMYEFFDRLVSIAIPRIRDFRGLNRKAFDGRGNYTLGIKEQIVFLEVDRDKISRITGMDINICTSAPTNEQAFALLEEMGMPFRKN